MKMKIIFVFIFRYFFWQEIKNLLLEIFGLPWNDLSFDIYAKSEE